MADWRVLATQEANKLGAQINIVLATVDAETSGTNITGDSGEALGYGQVWPKWHIDAFYAAGQEYNLVVPDYAHLADLTALTLSNDAFSMSVAVRVIKDYWDSAHGDFNAFLHGYVGPAITQDEINRRNNILQKYNSGSNSVIYLSTAPTDQSGLSDNGLTIPTTNFEVVDGSAQKGDILFGRRYRLIISTNGETALEVKDLRCTFNIFQTMNMATSYSEIMIYNLSAQTENTLINEGDRIILEAGYEGKQYGLVFDGNVVQPIREKVNATDYRLTLRAMDGDRYATYAITNFSLVRGQNNQDILIALTNKASLPIQLGTISDKLSSARLPRGKVVFGLASDYLRQIAQSEKATYYIHNGMVNIIRMDDLPEGEVVDLSPTTGLVGTPQQTQYGAQIRCLINPQIKLNSLVHVDNSLIRANEVEIGQFQQPFDTDGIYRVIQMNILGDTRGNEWYMDLDTVTQLGQVPSLMGSMDVSPW